MVPGARGGPRREPHLGDGGVERIFAPWRGAYVTRKDGSAACVFCAARDAPSDREALVLARGSSVLALLNAYPFTSGHLMIAPNDHVAWPSEAPADVHAETARLLVAAETVLRSEYRAEALNVGMNLGIDAGAGVPGHLHLHVVPRWRGDSNFMAAVAGTRVLPEDLLTTYERLRGPLEAALAAVGSP